MILAVSDNVTTTGIQCIMSHELAPYIGRQAFADGIMVEGFKSMLALQCITKRGYELAMKAAFLLKTGRILQNQKLHYNAHA
jgi:hypothetical protein